MKEKTNLSPASEQVKHSEGFVGVPATKGAPMLIYARRRTRANTDPGPSIRAWCPCEGEQSPDWVGTHLAVAAEMGDPVPEVIVEMAERVTLGLSLSEFDRDYELVEPAVADIDDVQGYGCHPLEHVRLLHERDMFIVQAGLWGEFVKQIGAPYSEESDAMMGTVAESLLAVLTAWFRQSDEWIDHGAGIASPSTEQCEDLILDLADAAVIAIRKHDAEAAAALTPEKLTGGGPLEPSEAIIREYHASWQGTVEASDNRPEDVTRAAFEAGYRAALAHASG